MGERTRRRFTREFKLEAVRQVLRDDRTQRQVAEELGLVFGQYGLIQFLRPVHHNLDLSIS